MAAKPRHRTRGAGALREENWVSPFLRSPLTGPVGRVMSEETWRRMGLVSQKPAHRPCRPEDIGKQPAPGGACFSEEFGKRWEKGRLYRDRELPRQQNSDSGSGSFLPRIICGPSPAVQKCVWGPALQAPPIPRSPTNMDSTRMDPPTFPLQGDHPRPCRWYFLSHAPPRIPDRKRDLLAGNPGRVGGSLHERVDLVGPKSSCHRGRGSEYRLLLPRCCRFGSGGGCRGFGARSQSFPPS